MYYYYYYSHRAVHKKSKEGEKVLQATNRGGGGGQGPRHSGRYEMPLRTMNLYIPELLFTWYVLYCQTCQTL